MPLPIRDRIELGSIPEPNTGCILWIASYTSTGYGQITYNGRNRKTHSVVYELANGPIPVGKVIRHMCNTPKCVNILHLKMGTQKDNVKDMIDAGRHFSPNRSVTHCLHGHEFNEKNTAINFRGKNSTELRRSCRECARLRHYKYNG